MDDVLEILKARAKYSTHYEGCESSHLNCAAIKELESQRAEITRLTDALRDMTERRDAWKAARSAYKAICNYDPENEDEAAEEDFQDMVDALFHARDSADARLRELGEIP